MCIHPARSRTEEVRTVSVTVRSDDPVLYELRDSGVAVLTLNRPERMNGWGGGLAAKFYALLDRAEADPTCGRSSSPAAGRAFCAGADMGDLSSIEKANTDGETDIAKLVGERHPHFVATLRKPVIAAINGACAGIGLTQALMCDVRFAAAGREVHHLVRASRPDRGVRHQLDTAARRRLGRRDGPAAVRPRVPCRGGRGSSGSSKKSWRPTSCCPGRSPTPRTSPRTARRVLWR